MNYTKKNKNGFAVSLTAFSMLLFAGCGSNNSGTTTNGQAQVQNPGYSYSLTECAYQSPVYSTLQEYCSALEDSRLNSVNGRECADQEREQLFTQVCGNDWNPGNGGGHPPGPGPGPQPQPPQPQPQPPHPPTPVQSVCTIRNGADASGRPVYNVVTQDGAILGAFPTSEQAAQFAESDPRCRR